MARAKKQNVWEIGKCKGGGSESLSGEGGNSGWDANMREKISKNATIKCDFSKFSSQREVKTPSP